MMQIEHEVRRAAELWNDGKTLEAGRILFETIPPDARPGWASTILRLAIAKSGMTCSPVEEIADIAEHPEEWGRAHQVFNVLREATLDLEAKRRKGLTKQENLLAKLLLIAELVAKVTYNTTDPPDEFDEDSGWWIAVTLRDFLNYLGDESFSRETWLALSTCP
ncbi:MAG: hypothetical protein GY797_36620 [Deltaproteobacteria bacterium]|nr:hypothetical protein [Deltaproteobacteria bacterium]